MYTGTPGPYSPRPERPPQSHRGTAAEHCHGAPASPTQNRTTLLNTFDTSSESAPRLGLPVPYGTVRIRHVPTR